MWFLYAFSYRKACDIREAEFSRRPVKDHYSDSPLTFSPVLNVFVAKLASGCFSHQTWVLLRWTKNGTQRKSVSDKFCKSFNMCRKSQSLLQNLQTAALLARCKFCFQGTKWNSTEIYEWQKSWDMCKESQRPQEVVLNICSAVWCIL